MLRETVNKTRINIQVFDKCYFPYFISDMIQMMRANNILKYFRYNQQNNEVFFCNTFYYSNAMLFFLLYV